MTFPFPPDAPATMLFFFLPNSAGGSPFLPLLLRFNFASLDQIRRIVGAFQISTRTNGAVSFFGNVFRLLNSRRPNVSFPHFPGGGIKGFPLVSTAVVVEVKVSFSFPGSAGRNRRYLSLLDSMNSIVPLFDSIKPTLLSFV